jgi:endoplasmic reticulum-Golgi intermediate compartment protein 3
MSSSTESSSLADRLRKLDTQSSVSSEFRVYTLQGAIVSVLTVSAILYLFVTEFRYNFTVIQQQRVYVNATTTSEGGGRLLELEFDISLPEIPCSVLNIDAMDPHGQDQSLHLDTNHHVWKHRMKIKNNQRILLGSKTKLEFGSTLLHARDVLEDSELSPEFFDALQQQALLNGTALRKNSTIAAANVTSTIEDDACGSCFGAGDEGECCNTCDDVKRAYKRRGWVLKNEKEVPQCRNEAVMLVNNVEQGKESEDEGCNVHGVVALAIGGGNLHLAPSKNQFNELSAQGTVNLFDLLMSFMQEWNVTHTIHKIRFGPEYPSATYQLDNHTVVIADTYGMYQYYFQVRTSDLLVLYCHRAIL